MFARIAGLGQWFPERIRHNAEWPADFGQRAKKNTADRTLADVKLTRPDGALTRIIERHLAREKDDAFLGARQRHVAEDSISSARAESWAARAALDDAGVEASQVDAIFSWALVPDRIMPSTACAVAHLLGAHQAWAATVDAACASPVAQLGLAASLIESGRARTVLLTQSHLATRTFPLTHPASPCVGDGATALLVRAAETPGIGLMHSVTHGEHYDSVIWCRDKDPSKDTPWWQAGGPHFMSSHAPEVASTLIEETVPTAVRTIRELAQRASLELSEIDVIASIQPRAWVPPAIAEGLGLNPNIAPQTYEHVAHLGGVGAIVNLIEARRCGLLRKGANVVMYAQGAGFTRGAVRICW